MNMKRIETMNNDDIAVIDLDTGTVLGTNLRWIRWPKDEAEQQRLLTGDPDTWTTTELESQPLYIA